MYKYKVVITNDKDEKLKIVTKDFEEAQKVLNIHLLDELKEKIDHLNKYSENKIAIITLTPYMDYDDQSDYENPTTDFYTIENNKVALGDINFEEDELYVDAYDCYYNEFPAEFKVELLNIFGERININDIGSGFTKSKKPVIEKLKSNLGEAYIKKVKEVVKSLNEEPGLLEDDDKIIYIDVRAYNRYNDETYDLEYEFTFKNKDYDEINPKSNVGNNGFNSGYYVVKGEFFYEFDELIDDETIKMIYELSGAGEHKIV